MHIQVRNIKIIGDIQFLYVGCLPGNYLVHSFQMSAIFLKWSCWLYKLKINNILFI